MSDDAQQCADIGRLQMNEYDALLRALQENTAAMRELTRQIEQLAQDEGEDDEGGFATLGEV